MNTKEVSRSDMIRECLNNANKPSEKNAAFICNALKAKGITVSKQLVYQVKTATRKKRRVAAARTAATTKSNKDEQGSWLIAKNLLKSVGGDLTAAKRSLEIVSKILNS